MPARRPAAALAGLILTFAGSAPAQAAPTDPLRSLGGDSPMCARADVGADARASCRQSGAIERPYPLGRYRFDWHIDTGITKDPVDNLLAGVQ